MEIKRQVQLTGGSSFIVTLPKGWAKQQGIKSKSTLVMRILDDGGLIIYPEGRAPRREFREIVIEASQHVDRDITGAYLYGYDLIRITSPLGFREEEITLIKKTIRRLAGAEIVEEKPNTMEVQIMLDPEAVTPEKVLRRQYALVQGMVWDVARAVQTRDASLAWAIIQRDEEVDRHYFTLVRVIRSAIRNPEIGRKLKQTPLNLLDLRVAAKFLEDSGDQAVNIARELSIHGVENAGDNILKSFSELVNVILEMGNEPLDALLEDKPSLTLHVLSLRREFVKRGEEFRRLLSKASPKAQVILMHYYSCLDKICENLADISELGFPIMGRYKTL